MKGDIKRICQLCGVDRTPLIGGIYLEKDRRGEPLGLFGQCCCSAVYQAVRESPRAYQQHGREIRAEIMRRAKELAGVS